MTDTTKLKRDERLARLERMEELERNGFGHIEYDDAGNPVWVPKTGLSGAEVMRRLLDDVTLTVTEDESPGSADLLRRNPSGLKKGYDPYDSGMLDGKQQRKRKDLRALSAWIEKKKPGGKDRGR